KAAGLGYCQIGKQDYPRGTLRKLDQALGELKGFAAIKFSVDRVRNSALMCMRDAPELMREAGIEALIVDQAEISGRSIAEKLGVPFVRVSLFIPLILDSTVPFFGYHWRHGTSIYHRLRNRLGNAVFTRVSAPARHAVNEKRRQWGLPKLDDLKEFGSPLA